MVLGHLKIEDYLKKCKGVVTGALVTDAKSRRYTQEYSWTKNEDGTLTVYRSDGYGDRARIPAVVELTEQLVAFLGLYSGDGAKGHEDRNDSSIIIPTISFSQKESNLVRFAVDEFRHLFPGQIRFTFSLGEDSAYFMAGDGQLLLRNHYVNAGETDIPENLPLKTCRPNLNDADTRYLGEDRPDIEGANEDHLAFYYTHKEAMEEIFRDLKAAEMGAVGIDVSRDDVKVAASLRRPFKKGARQPGGSSRADEIHIGGLNGLGQLFLKMIHEVEDSILRDVAVSSTGLVEWIDTPSKVGDDLDTLSFFSTNSYGQVAKNRPVELADTGEYLAGKWARSSKCKIRKTVRVTPLWCYTSGLYLAEGTTPKEKLFVMFRELPGSMALGFTSSEGISLELMLRTLNSLFPLEDCLKAWKIKVGSQYFPELVVTGQKHGVSMLRGGNSGDGKLRTIEISLSVKEWGLNVADDALHDQQSMLHQHFADRYSHVEPTGSGVARIDFWASSALCRWYFPILMYVVFGETIDDPVQGFYQ